MLPLTIECLEDVGFCGREKSELMVYGCYSVNFLK